MRPAGSPGTCGAGFRVAARGDPLYAPSPPQEPATTYGPPTPSAPAQREETTTEGARRSPEPSKDAHGHLAAIPAPRKTTDPSAATAEPPDGSRNE